MANEQWRARVKRAQEMAAGRRGVDVAVMLPPRQPDGGGARSHQAAAEPVAAVRAQPEPVAVAASVVETAPMETAPVAVGTATPAAAETSSAQRVAEAKARAAVKGSNGSPTVPAAAPAAAPKPAAKPVPTTEEVAEEVGQAGINRREFLTYAWGAALGLLTVEIGVASFYFMYTRFRAGEFGGAFILSQGEVPPADAAPNGNTTGKFWLVDTAEGPRALYMVCTHLGCLYKWEPSSFRFECPCHASKFSHDGHYIEGPASRSLDQFVIEVVQNGAVVSSTEDAGDNIVPPQLPGPDAQIVVQTGRRILGKSAADSPARAVT